ncbi:WD40-repeat-containing domain protein [Fomes fomentarius]|nr:WD40-repeat-containing domain protein [Fomes fomentarius]
MSHFSPTHIFLETERAVVVTGPHFHLLNSLTADLIHSTTRLRDDVQQGLRNSGPIRCIAFDTNLSCIATTGDDKKLKVWKVADNLELLHERMLPKKPTEVAFTADGQTVVISDKFGDVFSYPLNPEPTLAPSSAPTGASKRGSVTSHENPSNGTLILGHASMLTTFLLTPDEQYIITADRDEHIRVSWFPQGYAVERYCLGHEKFVSALHIPSFQHNVLVSGGGDPVLKVWDWMSGKVLADIPVSSVVEPYIQVKAPKRRRGWDDGDGDGDGDNEEQGTKGEKGKGRRSRGKGKGKGKIDFREESANVESSDANTGEEKMPDTNVNEDVPTTTGTPEEVLVFVVHKISSVNRGEHGRFIVFSIFGATALFYTSFPENSSATSTSTVQAVDFGVPVISFSVAHNGDVWASLDAERPGSQNIQSEKLRFVRLLTWAGPTLSESADWDAPLLSSLNATCLVPATSEELKTLDLYSDLSSMPKNVDPEHDPLIRDTLSEAAAFDPEAEGKQLTQRELGRLKKKKALLAKIQEREQQKRGASEGIEAEAGREMKRTKSESEHNDEGGGDVKDVEMDAS